MNDLLNDIKQDMREERLVSLWRRLRTPLITLVVFILVATAGWTWYQQYRHSRHADDSLQLARAKRLDQEGKTDQALQILQQVNKTATYQALAGLEMGSIYYRDDQLNAAIKAYQAVAQNQQTDPILRDFGRFMQARIQIDREDPLLLRNLLEPLIDRSVWALSAREMLALVAVREDRLSEARRHLKVIQDNGTTPGPMQDRVEKILLVLDNKS